MGGVFRRGVGGVGWGVQERGHGEALEPPVDLLSTTPASHRSRRESHSIQVKVPCVEPAAQRTRTGAETRRDAARGPDLNLLF